MPQVGPLEILVIFVIALVVFGPNEIPKLARQGARAWRELQRFQATVRRDIDDVLREVDAEDDADDDDERTNRPPRLPPKQAELSPGPTAVAADTAPDATAPDGTAPDGTAPDGTAPDGTAPGGSGPADPTP